MQIILSAVIIYLVIFFLMIVFQRRIIYYPYKLDRDFVFPQYVPELEEVFIACEDGCTINGLFAAGQEEKPLVLLLHGNAGNITHRDFLLRGFNSLGYAVLLIDYHGYGKSQGTPSESTLYLDGEAALQWLRQAKEFEPGQILLFAKSLGSGVGVELATKYPLKGVILEAPFASIASLAGSLFPYNCFPVRFFIRDKFDNIAKIDTINAPLLLIHGTRDSVIDKKESVKLFEKAKMPKEIYFVEGADHNDIQFINPQTYWHKISAWIEALA